MNVESPAWASLFPNARMPLSAGLRRAFGPAKPLPPELEKLLNKLERRRVS